MKSDLKAPTAELTLCAAIDDYSSKTGISAEEIRNEIIETGAYDVLFDYSTGLWQEGPDYLIDFFLQMKKTDKQNDSKKAV